MWKRLVKGALAATVGVGAVLSAAAAVAAEPIKLGASLAVTGPASFLGDPAKKTLEMLTDRVNEKGGVDGRPIELIVYDDGGDPNKAVTNFKRLIDSDEVDVLLGPSTTGTTMAVIPLAERAETPMVSLAGAVPIVEPVKKWVFKTPHTDRMVCMKIFQDVQKNGGKNIGLISGTGGFGKSMRDECVKVADDFGITIAADETYGPKDVDMTVQLTRIKNMPGIDAVVNADFGSGPAIVTRNYRQLGIGQPFYQSHGVASKEYIKLASGAADGVRLPAAANIAPDVLPADHPLKEVVAEYKASYEERFNEPVSAFGANAYDGFWLAVNAIDRAGGTDKAKVRDEIEATEAWPGANGVFTMTPDDHNGLDYSSLVLLEIRNGDWTLAQ